ncbi:MAG: hypothetical protein HY529_01005, partial [Chloroflexi bacterium]|nr:hypothetical protein [Chloroflexota bacterium]
PVPERGGAAGPTPVSLTGITGSGLTVNTSTGATSASVLLTTSDGKATISIAAGTIMHNANGTAVTSLSATPAIPPSPPPQGAVIINYNFGPENATFSPSLVINLTYADSDIPAGASEADLYAAYWDGSQWVKLESTVNTETNTISAKVPHFTNIAVLSAPPPAPVTVAPPLLLPPATLTPSVLPPTAATEPVVSAPPAPAQEPAVTSPPEPTTALPAASEPAPSPRKFNWALLAILVGIAAIAGAAYVMARRKRQTRKA